MRAGIQQQQQQQTPGTLAAYARHESASALLSNGQLSTSRQSQRRSLGATSAAATDAAHSFAANDIKLDNDASTAGGLIQTLHTPEVASDILSSNRLQQQQQQRPDHHSCDDAIELQAAVPLCAASQQRSNSNGQASAFGGGGGSSCDATATHFQAPSPKIMSQVIVESNAASANGCLGGASGARVISLTTAPTKMLVSCSSSLCDQSMHEYRAHTASPSGTSYGCGEPADDSVECAHTDATRSHQDNTSSVDMSRNNAEAANHTQQTHDSSEPLIGGAQSSTCAPSVRTSFRLAKARGRSLANMFPRGDHQTDVEVAVHAECAQELLSSTDKSNARETRASSNTNLAPPTTRGRSLGSTTLAPTQMVKLQAAQRQITSNETTTRLLIAVMILFLACEFPAGILAALCAILGQDFFENVYQPMGIFTDLLALINSSVNFILYCCMSTQFRITFYQTVLHCPAPNAAHQAQVIMNAQLNNKNEDDEEVRQQQRS